MEGWEKVWTVGMGTGGFGEGLDVGHEDWRGGRWIGLWT